MWLSHIKARVLPLLQTQTQSEVAIVRRRAVAMASIRSVLSKIRKNLSQGNLQERTKRRSVFRQEI